jgi:hypothetical protein
MGWAIAVPIAAVVTLTSRSSRILLLRDSTRIRPVPFDARKRSEEPHIA